MSDTEFGRGELLDFAKMLAEKGLAKPNTAIGMRVAAGKILDGLTPREQADVRTIDVGLAVRKFNNKNPSKLSPKSLGEYQRRVESLIAEFVKYRADPTNYRGLGRGAPNSPRRRRDEPRPAPTPAEPLRDAPRAAHSGLSFDYPLRADFLAQVVVPRDMKVEEARRLCAFLMTLAADFSPGAS